MQIEIKEQTFIDLGFERTDVPMEESGCGDHFYYYILDIGDLCIISNDDKNAKDIGQWNVGIFDFPSLEIYDKNDFLSLIDILKRNTDKYK
jgi:hypothetical protein